MSGSENGILPGATLGMLGSGQLGRMFAVAARQMGYRVHVLSPDSDTPTGHIADREVVADYTDLEAVAEFASRCDAVSYEFENVPAETVAACEQHCPVRPSAGVLHIIRDRIREKTWLTEHGFPVTPFRAVTSPSNDVANLVPGVLKTTAFGYDGKGQAKVGNPEALSEVWNDAFDAGAILEKLVDFQRELSVVVARGVDGSVACYPPFENDHANHILDVTVCPANVDDDAAAEATRIAAGIAEKIELVGVLCVELFHTVDGRLLVNELAPRPHNSGHLTIEASNTSQFEQQVRAVCGLPLGSTTTRPAAMANLLGNLWEGGEPNWAAVLAAPGAALHLYGKREAKVGRKMGHITVVGEDAAGRVRAARETLKSN